jgi:hypothetical protein
MAERIESADSIGANRRRSRHATKRARATSRLAFRIKS